MVSRLPWSEELPRLWIATMRPMPVMIPVNMQYFRRDSGRPKPESEQRLFKDLLKTCQSGGSCRKFSPREAVFS